MSRSGHLGAAKWREVVPGLVRLDLANMAQQFYHIMAVRWPGRPKPFTLSQWLSDAGKIDLSDAQPRDGRPQTRPPAPLVG